MIELSGSREWSDLTIAGGDWDPRVALTGPAPLIGPLTIIDTLGLSVENLICDGGTLRLEGRCDVVVSDLDFSRCSDPCVRVGELAVVVVRDCSVYDCSSHFVVSDGALLLERCVGDRLLNPNCEHHQCPEYIRVAGGATVARQFIFGDVEEEGPQIRVFPQDGHPPIRQAHFESGLLRANGRNVTGIDFEAGVASRPALRPQLCEAINMTILTSNPGVGLGSGWEDEVPGRPPPLVANCAFKGMSEQDARRGRFVACTAERMSGGSVGGVDVGPLELDADARPTAGSVLIGTADPAFAPALDVYGQRSAGLPDRGGVWYRPAEVPAPKLKAIFKKTAVVVQWDPADFPDAAVHVIVYDGEGKRLTWFATANDGEAYTTFPLTFHDVRQFRAASIDETILSDPLTITT